MSERPNRWLLILGAVVPGALAAVIAAMVPAGASVAIGALIGAVVGGCGALVLGLLWQPNMVAGLLAMGVPLLLRLVSVVALFMILLALAVEPTTTAAVMLSMVSMLVIGLLIETVVLARFAARLPVTEVAHVE